MEPIDALERVVYLQDRGLLPSQKTAAFLKAADILRDLPDGELDRRIAAGTLTELAGIGPSTAEVITQAARGEVPKRITDLEASTQIPLGPGADRSQYRVITRRRWRVRSRGGPSGRWRGRPGGRARRAGPGGRRAR